MIYFFSWSNDDNNNRINQDKQKEIPNNRTNDNQCKTTINARMIVTREAERKKEQKKLAQFFLIKHNANENERF